MAGGHADSGHPGRISHQHPGPCRGRHLLLRHRAGQRHHRSRHSEADRSGRRPARAAAISVLPDYGRCCVHGLVAGGIRHDPARDGSCEALGCGSDVDGHCAQLRHEYRRVRADQPVRHRHGHDGPSGRHRSQSAYASGRSADCEPDIACCRGMDVPGPEHRHRPSRLCNRAGGGRLHAHDSPHIKS